jgi:hypothetical protein
MPTAKGVTPRPTASSARATTIYIMSLRANMPECNHAASPVPAAAVSPDDRRRGHIARARDLGLPNAQIRRLYPWAVEYTGLDGRPCWDLADWLGEGRP